MLERQQSTQEQAQQVMADGGVVIYWRPGCPSVLTIVLTAPMTCAE